MIPETPPGDGDPRKQEHRPPAHTYSAGEEIFDSLMSPSTFFGKTRSGNPLVDSDDDDGFDPFKIGGDAGGDRNGARKITKNDNEAERMQDAAADSGSHAPAMIPPKLLVKFRVHEEVSSAAPLSQDCDGESKVYVQGTVQAQIVSSDAMKNAPFMLKTSMGSNDTDIDQRQDGIEFRPNELYTKESLSKEERVNIVTIPKDIVGFVTVGTYSVVSKVKHMPLLLEQKVARSSSKIQLAIQVRSKLTNPDELTHFTVVVSIPARVNSNSIGIVAGQGHFDRTKRCITWEMTRLPKGESFMMSAKCELDETAENTEAAVAESESLEFPVMLRCSSNDQISNIQFQAVQASGYPASVSSSTVGKSFRIIHRLR
jgi:hypothetical protein